MQSSQEAVVPAAGRFLGLGGDHIVRVGRQLSSHLHGAHQAGVEADPVQLPRSERAGGQRLGQLLQAQMIAAEQLVPADPLHGPAAVVPQDQGVALRRTGLDRVLQEGGKSFPLPHVPAAESFQNPLPAAADFGDDRFLRRAAVVPEAGSAGVDQHRSGAAVEAGLCHLPKIRGCGAVLALQIAAAHVDHDGDLPSGFRPGGPGEKQAQEKENPPNRFSVFLHGRFFCLSEGLHSFQDTIPYDYTRRKEAISTAGDSLRRRGRSARSETDEPLGEDRRRSRGISVARGVGIWYACADQQDSGGTPPENRMKGFAR